MFDFIPLVLLLLAALVVMPILGTIAFVRVRRLQREVDFLRETLQRSVTQPVFSVQLSQEMEPAEPAVVEEPADPEPSQPDQEAVTTPASNASPESDATENSVSSQPATSGSSLEETVGAKWAVWVGGLALALGGVFLVRYSIEQGLLGPAMRILLGGLFSLALGGVGEWTRRRGSAYSIGGFESANIPAILTAAGTMGAFATIYSAYQLYGFLSAPTAFVALGIVAVGTMFAALLHGPLLAALGLVGSYFVPFLVDTREPSAAGLAIYALAVSLAAFGVGRLRLWRWLAIIAALGLMFFGLVLFSFASLADRPVLGLYILASWAIVFYVFVASLYARAQQDLVGTDKIAVALLSLVLLLQSGYVTTGTGMGVVIALLLGVFIPFAAAFYWSSIRMIVPVAAVITVLGYSSWHFSLENLQTLASGLAQQQSIDPETLPGYQQSMFSTFAVLGAVLSLLAGVLGYLGAMRSASRVPLAFGGAFVPALILAVAYARTDFLEISVRYGSMALVLCMAFYAIAMFADKRIAREEPGRDGVTATYLVASLSVLALGLCMLLERGALTVALALMAPATAWVYTYRPVPALRALTLVPALLWVARIVGDPSIVGHAPGTTPIFNWLLYGYGIPAAGFVLAAWLLGTQKRDRWLEIMEGVAVATTTAAIAIVSLHALDPTQVFTRIDTLSEAALMVLVGGGVALGLLRLKRTNSSTTLRAFVDILGFAGMAAAVAGLLVAYNPLLTGETIGAGAIFNKLLFAYFLTGLLYGALGYLSAGGRPLYSRIAFGVSGLLGFAWVSLTIRHWFHPLSLNVGSTGDAELYGYSAAWLLIGIATLAAGIFSGTRVLRQLSAFIILVVVVKVFVIDMASLTGFLRATSFIGLGIVLVAIGLVYQRLLRRQR